MPCVKSGARAGSLYRNLVAHALTLGASGDRAPVRQQPWICSTCLLLLLISKILKGLDYDNTTLVDCLFSPDDFDCSVIRTWGNDKSKAVVGGVTIPQTWREHLPENGS